MDSAGIVVPPFWKAGVLIEGQVLEWHRGAPATDQRLRLILPVLLRTMVDMAAHLLRRAYLRRRTDAEVVDERRIVGETEKSVGSPTVTGNAIPKPTVATSAGKAGKPTDVVEQGTSHEQAKSRVTIAVVRHRGASAGLEDVVVVRVGLV